jgi:hypothetical protein
MTLPDAIRIRALNAFDDTSWPEHTRGADDRSQLVWDGPAPAVARWRPAPEGLSRKIPEPSRQSSLCR